jgi:hypothetical protein
MSQIVIVKDPHMGHFAQRTPEVCHSPRIPGFELLFGHIVAALGNAHAYTFFGNSRTGDPDEAKDNGVPGCFRVFEEGDLIAHWIGKDRLKDKALPLADKLFADRISHSGCFVRAGVKFSGQHIGIHKTQTGLLKVRVEECRFAGAVRAGNRNDDRAAIEWKLHYFAAFLTDWAG